MDDLMSNEFMSRAEIEESFQQFVASFSTPTASTSVTFHRAPMPDVCLTNPAAVLTALLADVLMSRPIVVDLAG